MASTRDLGINKKENKRVRLINAFGRKTPEGFTLIELIVIVSGLAILTSFASIAIQSVLSDFENDEIQAHLNSLAADCLKTHANLADTNNVMPSPTSVDTNLIDRNNYEENSGNTCKYFQVNPKDSSSKTHFAMGFGISYGKVTKFAIKDAANTSDIAIACKGWAGDGNCLASGSDYSAFFDHMDNVRKARATCNINLRNYLASTPPPSPADGGNKKTWDSNADKDCKNKTLPANAGSYSTATCKTDGCTKSVKIKDGKIVGYTDSDYNQARTIECSNSISAYINSDDYNGGAIEKKESDSDYDADLPGCTGTKYICDYSEHSSNAYKSCKIQAAISKCTIDLETIRNAGNGTYTVGASDSLEGLPPCGQKVWVCNKVIHETESSYLLDKTCFP